MFRTANETGVRLHTCDLHISLLTFAVNCNNYRGEDQQFNFVQPTIKKLASDWMKSDKYQFAETHCSDKFTGVDRKC